MRTVPADRPKEGLRRTQAVRMLIFKEMERLICEQDVPIIPLYFYVTKNLVKPYVGGFYAYLKGPNGEKIPNVRDLHPVRSFFIKKTADTEQ